MSMDFAVLVPKIDKILKRGLSNGLGTAGKQVCVEAAICEALGLPHGDDPKCVVSDVRAFKIRLNDSNWSSAKARAKGLRDLAIAQLGTKDVLRPGQFSKLMVEKTIRVLIPTLFREVLKDDARCMAAADQCEKEGTGEAARKAHSDADDAAYDAAGPTAAARAAYAAAARAAADAAAAAYAAAADDAAADAKRKKKKADPDKYLLLVAKLALEVLTELKAPGVAYL
jgi:hypothetical protein